MAVTRRAGAGPRRARDWIRRGAEEPDPERPCPGPPPPPPRVASPPIPRPQRPPAPPRTPAGPPDLVNTAAAVSVVAAAAQLPDGVRAWPAADGADEAAPSFCRGRVVLDYDGLEARRGAAHRGGSEHLGRAVEARLVVAVEEADEALELGESRELARHPRADEAGLGVERDAGLFELQRGEGGKVLDGYRVIRYRDSSERGIRKAKRAGIG